MEAYDVDSVPFSAPADRNKPARTLGLVAPFVVCLTMAFLFAGVTALGAYRTYVLLHQGKIASGVIVPTPYEDQGRRAYVSFRAEDGQQYVCFFGSFYAIDTSHRPGIKVGDVVEVLYEPSNPVNFRDARVPPTYGPVLWSAVVTVALAVVGTFTLWRYPACRRCQRTPWL